MRQAETAKALVHTFITCILSAFLQFCSSADMYLPPVLSNFTVSGHLLTFMSLALISFIDITVIYLNLCNLSDNYTSYLVIYCKSFLQSSLIVLLVYYNLRTCQNLHFHFIHVTVAIFSVSFTVRDQLVVA